MQMYAQNKSRHEGLCVEIITYVKKTRLCKTSLKPRCFQVKILTGKLAEEKLGVKLIMKIAFCYLHTCEHTNVCIYAETKKDL